MYQPLKNSRTGKEIFPGLAPGSELGWSTFGGQQPFAIGAQMYPVHGLQQPGLGLQDAELRRAHGEGGCDRERRDQRARSEPEAVCRKQGQDDHVSRLGRPADSVGQQRRLLHARDGCDGWREQGEGERAALHGARHEPLRRRRRAPTTFDMVAALEQWVENGKAPDSIPASRVDAMARPIARARSVRIRRSRPTRDPAAPTTPPTSRANRRVDAASGTSTGLARHSAAAVDVRCSWRSRCRSQQRGMAVTAPASRDRPQRPRPSGDDARASAEVRASHGAAAAQARSRTTG